MTIDEKVAQLMGLWFTDVDDFDNEYLNDPVKMKETFGNGCNSIHPTFHGIIYTIEQRNKIQKYLLEETRLGIPAIFVDEGQHGMMRPDATVFPQAIGLACSWNPELFEKVYSIVAHEMRSRGTHYALSPVIDVCRDPRWGRVEETYGEDPYLNSVLGCAAIKGLQGSVDGTIAPGHVAATLKHLVGHGESEGGQNQGPANFSIRVLREFHMPPFKMCIEKVKPATVMPSYNEVDGVPSHANTWLLKEVLRKEWGFDGFVVSDYTGVSEMITHGYGDLQTVSAKAVDAGLDMDMVSEGLLNTLEGLVK
jgi:beta-glucosidase